MTTTPQPPIPNHHASCPGFSGPAGFLVGGIMALAGTGSARLAENLSQLTVGDAVVDIGCGPGTAARHAARLGAQVTGVDPAPVMLRLARLLTRRPAPSVRYLQGSAEALPLPDSSASVVWSIACVHHWADLDAGLHEVRRILKPGGRLVTIERLSPPGATGLASHGWTVGQAAAFADLCLARGFTAPRTSQHRDGRKPKVSVTATAPVRSGPAGV